MINYRKINKRLESEHNHKQYRKMICNALNFYSYMQGEFKECNGKLIPKGIEVYDSKRKVAFDNTQLIMIAQFIVIVILFVFLMI